MVMSPSWVAGWCTMSSQRRMYVGLQWHIRKMGLVCYPLTLRPSPWSESLDKPLIQCVTVCDATHWYAVRSLPPQWSRYCTKLHMKRNAEKTIIIIICPIAIAYSMGQIIKSVCVCRSVCLSVCVCPSASTLTVAFLDRFSQKLAQT